jgi:hypothetical protein
MAADAIRIGGHFRCEVRRLAQHVGTWITGTTPTGAKPAAIGAEAAGRRRFGDPR